MAKIQRSDLKKAYPDISKQLGRKQERRKQLAKLPVAKKLEMVTRLRDTARTIKAAKPSPSRKK